MTSPEKPSASGPPTVIPSIVDTLEPDLAAAYRGGNAAVIQAVAGGATTTQQVVNDMIRMGVTTGLPPGVQELVSARLEETRKQAAAESGQLGKLAAEVIGIGLMATGAAAAEQGAGAGDPNREMWKNTSSAELAQMSFQDWSKLSEGQKQGLTVETGARAQDLKTEASKILGDLIDQVRRDSDAKGLTAEQNQERTRDILTAVTQTVNHDGLDLKTPEGLAAAKANIAKLKPEDQALALKVLDAYAAVYHGQAAEDKVAGASKPGTSDPDRHHLITGANGNIAAGTQHIEQAKTLEQQGAAYAESDAALRAAARIADSGGTTRAAGSDNLDAGAKVDDAAAKTEKKAALADGGFDEEPATQVASAAPRAPSIDIPGGIVGPASPLLAQLGVPVAPAANDPAPLAAEAPEKRRPVAGAGMTA